MKNLYRRLFSKIFFPLFERLNTMATKDEVKQFVDDAVDKVTTAAAGAIDRAVADIAQLIQDSKNGAVQIADLQPSVDKLSALSTTLDDLDLYKPEEPVPGEPTE
jgi:hypothetical protein